MFGYEAPTGGNTTNLSVHLKQKYPGEYQENQKSHEETSQALTQPSTAAVLACCQKQQVLGGGEN